MYEYSAAIVRVIDGDTIVVDLDMGRRLWVRDAKHRLAGCNAREAKMPGGAEATANLRTLLPAGELVRLRSLKPYKYGDEYMADITLPDGRALVPLLIADGWASPWTGRGPAPLPPWPRVTGVG